MPLPWVRLDTSMPDNPKILRLIDATGDKGLASAFVWVCGLAYAGKHGTDGLIEKAALGRLNGRPLHAKLLVEYGLWHTELGVGWLINGWAAYQESNEETQRRRDQARKAALKRWEKEAS